MCLCVFVCVCVKQIVDYYPTDFNKVRKRIDSQSSEDLLTLVEFLFKKRIRKKKRKVS